MKVSEMIADLFPFYRNLSGRNMHPANKIPIHSVLIITLSVLSLWAVPSITLVSKNAGQVGTYSKLELTVGLTASYANPYDPAQIDLWTEFTSPANKLWKVKGFYDGTEWKVRFAANEIGVWSYVVKATDASGTGSSTAGNFTCVASPNHGWVKVAQNQRYLCYDDGTSFYGVGPCYPWGPTTSGLDQLKRYGCNTWLYWNGTYDGSGGNNLIESMASGIGKYDQGKCTRIDSLIAWSEARGPEMILVIWPHDYLCENLGGWPSQWSSSPYSTITSCAAFYGDTNAWTYQTKLYRYIIARWGYSMALGGWQTVDEISGTCGWSNQATANAWTGKIAAYFQTNDPFRHPTEASQGNYWAAGDSVNDLSNTEVYGNLSDTNIASTVQTLWTGFKKPCIMGETGYVQDVTVFHSVLWSALAAGASITPLWWAFLPDQNWNNADSAQYPPFVKFIAGLNVAGLTSLAQAHVAVAGAKAWGITSDQVAFGWISGTISGKNLSLTGLANGNYQVEWWDCTAGTTISTNTSSMTNGTLTTAIPATSQTDMAYKILSSAGIVMQNSRTGKMEPQYLVHLRDGVLHCTAPISENITVDIFTALGRIVKHAEIARGSTAAIQVSLFGKGIYFLKMSRGGTSTWEKVALTGR